MAQRIIAFSGSGTLSTWTEPESLQNLISNSLLSGGWGVYHVEMSNYSPFGGYFTPSWTYQFRIGITASANENPERVKQAVIGHLQQWFTNVSLYVESDNVGTYNDNTGQTNYQPSNTLPEEPSALQSLLNNLTLDDDTQSAGAKFLGLSTGVLLIGGLAAVFLLSRSRPSVSLIGRG